MLFELPNLGFPDITQAVWKLLMQIPINQKMLNDMKSLDVIRLAQSQALNKNENELISPVLAIAGKAMTNCT